MKKSLFAPLGLAPALLFAVTTATAALAAATDITPLVTTHEYRLTIGQNTSIYKFHPDHTWEESYKGDVKTGQWKQTGDDAFTIGGFSFVVENNGDALRRSCGKTWRRGAPLAAAAGAPDITSAITGAEYRLAIGPNTSAYTFHADHTWEENYRGAVKGGVWRQTGPGALTIGGFSFTVVPETTGTGGAAPALRRNDNKTWRRAPTPAAAAPAAASSAGAAPAAADAAPNLIPAAPSHATPNYWCTWWSQADGKRDPALRAARAATLANTPAFDGDQGNPGQRDGLNHQLVFAPDGWACDYPDARADLHLVLDDGWDVPYGLDSAKSRAPFGSCIPDPARWPADAGATSAQRLRALNDAAKAAGWRGLGLWIAVQKQGETGKPANPAYDPFDSPNAIRPAPGTASLAEFTDYWRERVLWCRDAGITYWKADWGVHNHDPAYRRAMTELARAHHPGLIIEHATCMPPINGLALDKTTGKLTGSGRFSGNPARYLDETRANLAFAQILRTYDIVAPTARATTLDRVAWMLAAAAAQNSPVILNLEDMVCEAAALSCSFGAMRSRQSNLKNEVTAAVRWARIAPAVPANELPLAISDEILTDTTDFTHLKHWYKITAGKKGVYQRAPAIIARGLPLPRVTPAGTGAAAANAADSVPFVLATLHPNGTLALCAAARAPANARTPHPTPPADIEVAVDALHRKIALFGAFNAVTLQLAADTGRARPPGAPPPAAAPDNAAAAGKIRVWAQNLAAPAGARATDITARVQIKDNRLVIPATALAPLTARDSARDLSMPAVVLFAEPDIL